MNESQGKPDRMPGSDPGKTGDPKEGLPTAGGIAHDFNNLLSVISGYADLLHAKLAKAGPVPEELGEIEKAAAEAAALARRLFSLPGDKSTEKVPPRDRDALDATEVGKQL